jgi:glutaconate CoA-transferase subunit B
MSTSKSNEYAPAEMMATVLSRDLKDHEFGVFGTFSQIPWVACQMARATRAPNLSFACGPSGAVNSRLPNLEWAVSDNRMHQGAEFRSTLEWILDMQGNPKIFDFGFYGGFQIDKFGNLNMAYIGEQKQPKFRGPGTVGTMAPAWLNRYYLFTQSHNPRVLVDKVDFISGPGFIDGPNGRKNAGCPERSKGPSCIVTPICVFDFDEETKHARLKSVHPGTTVADVKEKTGFKPIIPSHVPTTEPPTAEELEFLRSFDPQGILPQLC